MLEFVQRHFTKRITALHEHALNLESPELRRLRADICLLHKITFGMCDIDLNNRPILTLRGCVFLTRGHR